MAKHARATLRTAWAQALIDDLGASHLIKFYNGTQPADTGTSIGGTLLATLTADGTPGSVSSGVLTFDAAKPAMIRKAVEKAVRDGLDDLVKRVKSYDEQADIWRFRVEEGIFYAVVGKANGRCMTLLTQQMFSENRKRRKRKRSAT